MRRTSRTTGTAQSTIALWNCGAEGDTDDPEILALRARQQRNLLTTLLLSQGTPMLLGGDEFGRSQGGNNNGWCQDNELSWFDWENVDSELADFAKRLIALRRSEPVFRRREFLSGTEERSSGLADVVWLRPDGEEMRDEDWENDSARALAVFLNGGEIPSLDRDGNRVEGRSFLIILNAHHEPVEFTVPTVIGDRWSAELATDSSDDPLKFEPGSPLAVESRSILILRRG